MFTIYFYSLLIVLLFTPFGFILSNNNEKNLDYFQLNFIWIDNISFIALLSKIFSILAL